MGQVPRFKKLSREDFQGAPSWFEPLFLAINETLGGLTALLSGQLTRGENILGAQKVDFTFTTKPALADTWPVPVKNELGAPPKHVWVSKLERDDGLSIDDPYSMSWKLGTSGDLQLSFQGLSTSAKYRASILYE